MSKQQLNNKHSKKTETSRAPPLPPLPLVLAEKNRSFSTPNSLAATGDFEHIPIEILEVITSQLKGRDLGALAATCRYFRKSTLVDRVAQAQVDFVPRARGVEPDTTRGETWPMLSYYFQCQSAAAAQSTALSLGRHHGAGLLVQEDGSDPEDPRGGEIGLYTWGRNFYGEVGDASFLPAAAPKRLTLSAAPLAPAAEALPAVVCCGAAHSAALSRKGDMFVWGLSSCNQLGVGGNLMELPVPRPLTAFDRRRIVSVASGANHTLAIDETGQLWTCGQGSRGQLGLGDNPPEGPFALLATLNGYKVVAVAAGVAHSVALTSDGSVFSWGDCCYGQLGHPAFEQAPGEFLNRPWKVQQLNPNRLEATQRVTAIAAGGWHTLMLTVTGDIFVCGRNDHGQLGLGHMLDVWAPTRIALDPMDGPAPAPPPSSQRTLDDLLAPSAPSTSRPAVGGWEGAGRRAGGFASRPRALPCPSPAAPRPSVARAVQVAGGLLHTVVLVMRGGRLEALACGFNGSGALGSGDLESRSVLRPVQGLAGRRVTAVVCGDEASAAIGGSGEVYLWGRNSEGGLGLGDDRCRTLPTQLRGFRAVHPDRTLRRRGAKAYATFLKRKPSSSSEPTAQGGAADAAASSDASQPDAFWIVRALWNKSRLGRVPSDVQDALTTTQNMLEGAVDALVTGEMLSDRGMVCEEASAMSVDGATVDQQGANGADSELGMVGSDCEQLVQQNSKRSKGGSSRRYSLVSMDL